MLAPLIETVETGRSPSDRLLADYHGPWHGDIDKVFDTPRFDCVILKRRARADHIAGQVTVSSCYPARKGR